MLSPDETSKSCPHQPELDVYFTTYKTKPKKSELRFLYTAAQSRHTFTFPVSYVQESLDLTLVERDTSDGLGGTSGLRCLEREPYELPG